MECTESQLLEVQSEVEVATAISNTAEYNQLLPKHLEYLTYRLKSEHFLCSFFNSITNLIQVQEVNKSTSSVSAGGTSTQTFTVTACPNGYSWKYLSTSTGWGTVSSVSLSDTTLTVTMLNVSNGSHGISFRGVLVYYPSAWNI